MHHFRPALTIRPVPTALRLSGFLVTLWTVLCLLATVMAPPAGAAQVSVPPYSARVLDTTGTLDAAQTAALTAQILAIEADTQAAVVVFMLPSTGEDAIEEYATRVFQQWKLGDAGRDDGILILVAKMDRRMRIEVGQGVEGSIPDVMAGRIIDQQMKPRFRDNDYAGGLETAIGSIGALVRGDMKNSPLPETSGFALSGGVTPFGWAFFATLAWSFAIGVLRALNQWKWPVTAGLVAAAPLLVTIFLKDAGIAIALVSLPAPLAFAMGFGCGRSRTVRVVAGSVVLVVSALVGTAYLVGADRFWWSFLYAMVGGVVCLLSSVIVIGVRMAYKRSLLGFSVRGALVAGIVTYVALQNPPGPIWSDWASWIPTAAAAGLAMLFLFLPSGGSNGGRVSSSRNGSSGGSSRSSSSSSSRSSSGGSSSGGGASGSW